MKSLKSRLAEAEEDMDIFVKHHEEETAMLEKKLKETEGKIKLLEDMKAMAIELAEYASYAEITGNVHCNRNAIRKYCDEIFGKNKQLQEQSNG